MLLPAILVALLQTAALPARSGPPEDEAAIRSALKGLEEAWNRHDMDAFSRLFAADADFVNVVGMRWVGRAAIKEAHVATHTTVFKNSRLKVGETTVMFLKPDKEPQ